MHSFPRPSQISLPVWSCNWFPAENIMTMASSGLSQPFVYSPTFQPLPRLILCFVYYCVQALCWLLTERDSFICSCLCTVFLVHSRNPRKAHRSEFSKITDSPLLTRLLVPSHTDDSMGYIPEPLPPVHLTQGAEDNWLITRGLGPRAWFNSLQLEKQNIIRNKYLFAKSLTSPNFLVLPWLSLYFCYIYMRERERFSS